jgi:hypothetical protein
MIYSKSIGIQLHIDIKHAYAFNKPGLVYTRDISKWTEWCWLIIYLFKDYRFM